MKRVVLFAMVLMLGVISVQAQWSVVPEAGMTVMKAGPMVDWKPSWKIGVEAGISLSEVRFVLYAKGI